jgi:TorA maturation chaperone TorD
MNAVLDSMAGAVAEETRERSSLYAFLAAIFRTEVTAELLQQLREPRFRAALSAAGVTLDDEFLNRPDDALLEDLAVEYTRLFVGPGKHIPPYASVHGGKEGSDLEGPATGRLRDFIAAAGIAYQSSYRGMADHICVELELMAKLTKLRAAAETAEESSEISRCLELERVFVEQFLAPWVPRFCAKAGAAAELPFYRQIAELTAAFIASEQQMLARPN